MKSCARSLRAWQEENTSPASKAMDAHLSGLFLGKQDLMHNHTLEMEAERMALGVEVNVARGEAAAQEKWTFLMQVESSKKGDVGWFWCPVSYPTVLD